MSLDFDPETKARTFVLSALRDYLHVEEGHLKDETIRLEDLGAEMHDVIEIVMEVEQDCQDLLDQRHAGVDHFHVNVEPQTSMTIATLVTAATKSLQRVCNADTAE